MTVPAEHCVFAFDVDHTLEVSEGPVTVLALRELVAQGHVVGLCGNWAVFVRAVPDWHRVVSFLGPLGISKATGVEELARPLGISAEDVVAFGDMPNDVPMLGWAGLGVAMGNAHQDAVAAADEVTASNTDDGVARVLERWWH